jgi:phosphoribosyl 1,2-cyclic phosphate phosphodiesterase
MQATLTILGSGTSMGVPTLGCDCAVCTSPDERDRRTRPSVAIQWQDHVVLIDAGPDFREQALRERLNHIDAVLYTHGHADHILGLDDLRPLSFKAGRIPLYAEPETAEVLGRIFNYTFSKENKYPTKARVELRDLPETLTLNGANFHRVPVQHGDQTISGFRFGNAAYLTDMSEIPDASMTLLHGVDVLVLDALRKTPHPSHANVERAIEYIERIKPRIAYFTHISHELGHSAMEAELPPNIRMAYDGLRIPIELA